MHFILRKRCRTTLISCCLLLLSVQIGLVDALRNVTVDDETGDELTGVVPTYTPSGSDGNWMQGATCDGCLVKPDASKAHGGTWHDATHGIGDPFQRAITITFNGTAVYAFLICANNVRYATTLTNLSFALDGALVGTFVHEPKATTDYEYNVPGYVNTGLTDGQHQLIIQTAGDANASLLLFDYLIYSTNQVIASSVSNSATSTSSGTKTATSSTPSSTLTSDQSTGTTNSSKTGPIVGAIVGVAAVAAITVLAFICWRRRGRSGVYFGKQRRANVNLDEDGNDYSMYNAAPPVPFVLSQNNSSEPLQAHMAESQYLMPSSEYTSSTRPTMTTLPSDNSSSMAVRNPDGSDLGRSDVGTASAALGGGAAVAASGAMLKAKERQTEIVRQVEEMQQRVALLRSRSTTGSSASRRGNAAPGSVSGTVSDGEVEMRNQIAALQAEVERLQSQQEYYQQLGWGNEPPPQYAESDGAGHHDSISRHML